VVAANRAAIELCRVGVRYRRVHDEASRVLATWLRDEGLLRCDPDTSIETGAHAMFFPHGVGHLLGMDVHDLRNFGDRAAYSPGRARSPLFGTGYLRLDMDLEPGFVVTVEPGFYIVPAILGNPEFQARFEGLVDFGRAREWLGFGGIRVEDDIVVTKQGPRNLTQGIPKDVHEIEAIVGKGPSARDRFLPAGPDRGLDIPG
jgi:Xaa-Pro aminopeptidase